MGFEIIMQSVKNVTKNLSELATLKAETEKEEVIVKDVASSK